MIQNGFFKISVSRKNAKNNDQADSGRRWTGDEGRGEIGGRLGGDWRVKGKGGICDRTERVVYKGRQGKGGEEMMSGRTRENVTLLPSCGNLG